MLNITASAAAFDDLRSVASSVKTFESLQQAGCSGGTLTKAAAVTSRSAVIPPSKCFCLSRTAIPRQPALFQFVLPNITLARSKPQSPYPQATRPTNGTVQEVST